MLDLSARVIPHLVGALAAFVGLSAFLLTDDQKMRRQVAMGSLMWCAHFAMLGAATASFSAALVAIRQYSSGYLSKQSPLIRNLSAAGFIGLFSLIVVLTWSSWLSLLPWIAGINATLAFIFLAGYRFRRQLLISDIALMANGLALGSPAAVLTHAVAVLFNARTTIVLRRAALAPA